MSDLKGVPKKIIATADRDCYPTTLTAYADLIVRNGIVVKDRHGTVGRDAHLDEIAACKQLTPDEARILIDAAAWRGEAPAEGTRRRLILNAIQEGDVLSDAEALDCADSVELALLRSTIGKENQSDGVVTTLRDIDDDEAMIRGGEAPTAGIEKVDPITPRWPTTLSIPIHELLDQANVPREEQEDGDAPRRIFPLTERLERLVSRCRAQQETIDGMADLAAAQAEQLKGNRGEASDEPGGDDPAATIKFLEGEVERLLGGREEARAGEGRYAEERDCAFALLRWLLPVTVAKRID